MGWNDRLHDDPYVPPNDYYQEQDHYEEWLHYQAMCAQNTALSSQNIDPAAAVTGPAAPKELPRGRLFRLWRWFTGATEVDAQSK